MINIYNRKFNLILNLILNIIHTLRVIKIRETFVLKPESAELSKKDIITKLCRGKTLVVIIIKYFIELKEGLSIL